MVNELNRFRAIGVGYTFPKPPIAVFTTTAAMAISASAARCPTFNPLVQSKKNSTVENFSYQEKQPFLTAATFVLMSVE